MAIAPDASRTAVNVAGSERPVPSAARHRSEFAAKQTSTAAEIATVRGERWAWEGPAVE